MEVRLRASTTRGAKTTRWLRSVWPQALAFDGFAREEQERDLCSCLHKYDPNGKREIQYSVYEPSERAPLQVVRVTASPGVDWVKRFLFPRRCKNVRLAFWVWPCLALSLAVLEVLVPCWATCHRGWNQAPKIGCVM